MDGRKCPVCGKVSSGKFCSGCGHKFEVPPQQQTIQQAQQPQYQQPQPSPYQQPVQQPQYQQSSQYQQPRYQQPQPSQYQQPQYQQPSQYQQPVQQPQYQQPVQHTAQSPAAVQQVPSTPTVPPYTPPHGRSSSAPEPPRKKSRAPLIIVLSLVAVLLIAAAVIGSVMVLGDKTYTVEFDPAGGKIISGEAEQEIEEGQDAQAPEVARDGWFFAGWEGDYSDVTDDVTITALWTEGVTVTFDPGEGEITDGEAEQFLESGSIPIAPDAVRDGYKFIGWEPSVGNVTEDTTYTAQWELIEYSPEELYEMATPSVVEIHVYDRNGEYFAQGSGFFIDSDGTVVTNYHVIEDAYSADAITSDEETHAVVQVLAWDKALDLAIIKCDISNATPLEISQREITTGEAVYTLGSSLGLTGTISDGIVSTASRDVDGVDCIQITAPISHGNSGGPLLNRFCEVIGINSMSLADGQNLNFAINIHLIESLDQSAPLTMEEFYEETGTGENDYMSDPGASVLVDSDHSEIEYNNTPITADHLYADTTMGGYVDPNDWDYYFFELSERTEISLELIPYYREDSDYLWSAILDEDLNIIDILTLNDSDPDYVYLSFTENLDAGTYFVYVEIDESLDYPYTIGAFYQLYYDVSSTGSSSSSGSSGSSGSDIYGLFNDYPDDEGAWVFEDADYQELEPNNLTVTADPLTTSRWTGAYCDQEDVDYFSFTLATTESISAYVLPYYRDDADYMEIAILDSNENVVGWLIPTENEDGKYFELDMTLTSGTYYFRVALTSGNYPYDVGAFYEVAVYW